MARKPAADAAPGQHDPPAQDAAAETAGVLDAVLRTAVRSAAARTTAERAAVTKPDAEPDASTEGTESPEPPEMPSPDDSAGDADGPDAGGESAQAQTDAEPDDAEPAGPEQDAEDVTDTGEGADDKAAGSRRRPPLVLGVAAAVLAGFAALAAVHAHDLRAQGTTRNAALTDAAATQQVKRQVGKAIDTIFSYNYASTAATKTAAQRLLTGPAVRQYDSLFKIVQQQAPAQHLVLTTQVTDIGVELLIGDRARLLVFADQRDTRTTTNQSTSYAGAMFAVSAVRRGGQWRIENIDTFAGGG